MAFRVKLTPRAQKDIEDIYRWVMLRAPLQGTVWYDGLIKEIGTLKAHPERCPISPEGLELGEKIRQLLYGRRPYRILFLVREKEVQILHVRRGSRKPWDPRHFSSP